MNTDHIPGLVPLPLDGLAEAISTPGVGFVTDAHLALLPVVGPVVDALPDAELIVIPAGEPTVETVDVVARRLASSGVGTVIGFGGGSVIDTAKLASLCAATGTPVEWHLGAIRPVESSLDVVAVPTTSGSGAEVTRTCVVSRCGRKSWAWNDLLRPSKVLVDPDVTLGLPRNGTIAGGLDALVHALEASTAPDAEPGAVESGSAAIEVIDDVLPVVVADGADRAARAEMLDAALCAGFAIDLAGTGIGHGVGHALASLIPIPHGLAVAFGMWSCLAWGMEAAPERYRRVDADGTLHERIGALLVTIGFEHELRKWATTEIDADALALELARDEHRPMCLNNARPVGDGEIATVARMVSEAWNTTFA